ncbi:MAG TPA: hypothetical protein VGN72_12535 [Tepidisphaeraceae bacterium]|jgi:hypothetical protein|nr:hypothetical protein [Tepidisphaeraceae bacterium]
MGANVNIDQDDADQTEGDLSEALSDGEVEFVSEEATKKGAGGMILFGLVVAAASATYFMYWKTGPASASAQTAEAQEATTTIKKFLDDGQVSLRTMEEMRKNTEKVVERFMNYPSMTQVPLSELKTNPFRTVAPIPTADATEAAAKRQREIEREATVKAVQNLSLQSVIVGGARSACMINRTLYTEGQQVDVFVIERITKDAVVVQANGFRFELKMAQ